MGASCNIVLSTVVFRWELVVISTVVFRWELVSMTAVDMMCVPISVT